MFKKQNITNSRNKLLIFKKNEVISKTPILTPKQTLNFFVLKSRKKKSNKSLAVQRNAQQKNGKHMALRRKHT